MLSVVGLEISTSYKAAVAELLQEYRALKLLPYGHVTLWVAAAVAC